MNSSSLEVLHRKLNALALDAGVSAVRITAPGVGLDECEELCLDVDVYGHGWRASVYLSSAVPGTGSDTVVVCGRGETLEGCLLDLLSRFDGAVGWDEVLRLDTPCALAETVPHNNSDDEERRRTKGDDDD